MKKCIECGQTIFEDNIYYKCLDNFLQVKYFDSENENIFCSCECFCKYLYLTEFTNGEECDD